MDQAAVRYTVNTTRTVARLKTTGDFTSWKPRGWITNAAALTTRYAAARATVTPTASTVLATTRVTMPAPCSWYGRASRGTREISPCIIRSPSAAGPAQEDRGLAPLVPWPARLCPPHLAVPIAGGGARFPGPRRRPLRCFACGRPAGTPRPSPLLTPG